MTQLNSSELERLTKFLGEYDLWTTVARLAGLLTVPSLQANTLRIETVVHLAVASCYGHHKPGLREIDNWLNQELGNTQIGWFEDPAEDVFISNVETPRGNRRIFEGRWASNDYFAQVVLETLSNRQAPQEYQNLLSPVFALLKLSDCVAEQVGLQRWHTEPSTPGSEVTWAPATQMEDRASAVTFIDSELKALDISRDLLAPFIVRDEDRQALITETIGHTSLERRPLVDCGGKLVLALPHAVSLAIIRFVLTELLQRGYLPQFSRALAALQAQQVEEDGLRDLRPDAELLEPPAPDEAVPFHHEWLLRHDGNRYLHVILIHDRLDLLETQGLSSDATYPSEMERGLSRYLDKISHHCASLPDFGGGTTLLVMGGLGRSFWLRVNEQPDRWQLSAIPISDFLMLVNSPDQPITRYLKCLRQRKEVEREGVQFQHIGSDYDFYCYWRRSNYQLVPRNLPVRSGSLVAIFSDFTLPIRQEARSLLDRHVLETPQSLYVPVRRFHDDVTFESLRERPIYGSLAHLSRGVLAGAVETSRGPSWLVVIPREGGEEIKRFLYQTWDGFIDLYDRLVSEVESLFPETSAGAMEICLDLRDVLMSENYEESQPSPMTGEPEVSVALEQRRATIKFPPSFLQHFQQPENTGETLVLRSIAKGLVSLHQGGSKDVEESRLNDLIGTVISDPGLRILHVFRAHDPIEQMHERQIRDPIFLSQEDFVFSKLKMSESCEPSPSSTPLDTKTECNTFLKKVVEKMSNQLREQLRSLDRVSVIRRMLEVHEAVIHDRDHWRRTAQALAALYASSEDVAALSGKRESDRATVSISVRTVLEMAICECPETGGRPLSRWELDELLARTTLLLEVATDSDAVKNDLVAPHIDFHPNGEYSIDRNFYKTVLEPFLMAYNREGFEAAVQDYDSLYQNKPSGERKRAEEIYPPGLIRAFQAEFGLTLDEAVNGVAELIDLAVECDSIIVETTLGEIKARLTSNRGLSVDAGEAFFRAFGLFHRPAWEMPPEGFTGKDLYPWRFSRRLSALVRPLFIFGEQDEDKVLFGGGALKIGLGHLLSRIEQGHLPQDFFTSTAMKKYIGMVNDEKGHAFTQSVSDQLREKEWQTRTEVPMTELGAPTKLGDVDVLAWKPSGEIQIVECKRLQLARTLAEIAGIYRRFRGEAKDQLDKHVRRVNWIRKNVADLQRIVGFLPNTANIDDRLVTSTHVPMTYMAGLPIEANKIGPMK